MTHPAIIELNDSGIVLADTSGPRLREPGYAWLTADGIRTGEEARRHAFLEPQRIYHRFWHQLSLAPLANANGHARHHADLAYNQLLHLHSAGGQPGEVVFAVPGTVSREQLSILLGLVEATPFSAVGLVDSAVAAAAGVAEAGDWLHLDVQLHQAVLTRLRVGEQAARLTERLEVQAIAGAGLKNLLDNWAQHIAQLFIRQYRYDPLHTAAGEQQLYDRMDDWLQRLMMDREIAIELESRRGTYSLNLSRDSFTVSNRAAFERLRQSIEHLSSQSRGLLISDRLAQLPAVGEHLGATLALPDDAAISGVRQHLDQLGAVDGGLILHTRIQGADPREAGLDRTTSPDSQTLGPSATHLLCDHRAHAIGPQLYVGLSAAEPVFTQQPPQPPWLQLWRDGGGLRVSSEGELTLSTRAPDGSASESLAPGTTLTVAVPGNSTALELTLIEVH